MRRIETDVLNVLQIRRRTLSDDQPALHYGRESKASTMKRVISSPAGSLAATARACGRHFSAKSGPRLSGTQICTGRKPAARIL